MQVLIMKKSGYLAVSGGHEIFYSREGNFKGETFLFLHGGPGGGTSEKDREFFDLEKVNVIFLDQRGAGKSKFSRGILEENTTDFLVQDIISLLNYLKISEKIYLFGGSWGSTLSLVFAIKYPEKVAGMVLRGIFLPVPTKDEFLFGNGPEKFFPEVYEEFCKNVPDNKVENILDFYFNKIENSDEKTANLFLKKYLLYEYNLASLNPNFEQNYKEIFAEEKVQDYLEKSLIETSFIKNMCYLPENYILDNCDKIENIKTQIIHGRYDCVCPAEDAWQLHKKMKNSAIYFPIAGHSSSDVEMKKELILAVERILK
jgi:proline iminopeptidase